MKGGGGLSQEPLTHSSRGNSELASPARGEGAVTSAEFAGRLTSRREDSRRLAFQVLLPLPERGEAVHHGAVQESTLTGGHVLGFARPSLLRRRLQGAAIAEGQLP